MGYKYIQYTEHQAQVKGRKQQKPYRKQNVAIGTTSHERMHANNHMVLP